MRPAVLCKLAALAAFSSLACGAPPAEPDEGAPTGASAAAPTATLIATPIAMSVPPEEKRTDALDATPLDVPARLPSLEVEGAPGALVLETLDVKVTVAGRLARTAVTQVYRNTLMRQVEGRYEMQLPEAAVISRLAMDVDGVMTEGELAEKERARGIYESIVRAQKDPALLEWQGNQRFKMQVFPIPASGTKTIILEYEELLPVRGQRVHYGYGLPALDEGRSGRIGRFSFALDAASTGAPRLESSGGGAYVGVTDASSVRYQEIDFVPRGTFRVSFPRPQPGSATVLHGAHGDDNGEAEQFFLADWVPDLPPATRAPPSDLVLVLDTSRGIGDRELLRAAEVSRALAARREGGRVVVVTGDLEATTCEAGAEACLAGLSAGGATRLETLLDAAARAATGLDDAAIILLTDGVATVGELDGDLLQARFIEQLDPERTSVFTVAIGHEPDLDFLAALANAGRGHPLRLTPEGSIDGIVESLAHLLSVPLLLDVSAEVLDGNAVLVERPPVHLRPGEPLAILGRTDGRPFEIMVSGRWNGEELVRTVQIEPTTTASDPLVTHFWARATIEALERAGAPRNDIVRTSLRYGVMSRATSFLVLENEAAYRRFGIERLRDEARTDERNKNLAKGSGPLQELLGGGKLSPAWGAGADDLSGSLGGLGGLGLRGTGAGGGATGLNTLGTGKVGTRGRGSGESGYGADEGGLSGLGGKRGGDRDVSMTQGSPVILGSLDKEVIRRVVKQHLAQLRYCYERELARTPGLFGKVVMKWVINGEGTVVQAQTAETTMRNANVEGCLATKIKTWKFPKPSGGGIVIINYPLVFRNGELSATATQATTSTPAPRPPPAPPPQRSLEEVILARRADLLDTSLLRLEVALRMQRGDRAGALRTLSELVELAPHDAARCEQYANELRARGQLVEACEELGHVATLVPARRDVYRSMMALRHQRGASPAALRSCIVDGVSRLPVQRSLSLVLTWEDPHADVDLHVVGPNGEHVSYLNREGTDGGLLYYDVTDGFGPEIYTLGQARKGRYRIGVVHYQGPAAGVRGTLTILEDAGTPAERRRHIPFRLGAPNPEGLRNMAELLL